MSTTQISKKRVNAAKILLPLLKTFVAPIFPEPIFLISLPIKILVKMSPNGIEPNGIVVVIISMVCNKTKLL